MPEDYNGPREADAIVAYAKDLAGRMQPPPEVVELTSAKVWDEECKVCFVFEDRAGLSCTLEPRMPLVTANVS